MDLTAPPLVPLAVLALASSGQVAPSDAPSRERAKPATTTLRGETAQGRPLTMRLREGRASWEIAYTARCDDGTALRGRYFSGQGTPEIEPGRGGRFRLAGSEKAEFRREGTGSARYRLSGRLARDGGSGTWRVRFLTPPGDAGRAACSAGPLSWRVDAG